MFKLFKIEFLEHINMKIQKIIVLIISHLLKNDEYPKSLFLWNLSHSLRSGKLQKRKIEVLFIVHDADLSITQMHPEKVVLNQNPFLFEIKAKPLTLQLF